MEIEYFGANCFRVKTKDASIVFDDNLDAVGAKTITKDADALFYTQKMLVSDAASKKARLVVDSAGEFEVGDVSVQGVQTRAHTDEDDAMTAAAYQCMYQGKTITILGHVHPDLTDEIVEVAGGTDVLILPVGGNGYTLDAVGAASVVKKIEPEVVIASQFEAKGFSFEVPAAPLEEFVKTSALTAADAVDVYKIDKPNADLATQTHIVQLSIKK